VGLLSGRVAVVTGGGRGIGASVCRLLAAEGAAVVVNDLGSAEDGTSADAGPAAEVAKEIVDAGGQAVANSGDVSSTSVGRELVEQAIDSFGKLDILVNAAGILRDRMIFNLSEEDWDAVIRVHLKGHYSTIRPAAEYWRQQRNESGQFRLINFTSGSGLRGSPGQPNYAAAKMGVVGLTYSCARALARYGVTSNAIAPGARTRLTETVALERRLRDNSDKSVSPDNIAPIVAYLASERSGWCTSRVIESRGYQLGLYNMPEVICQINSAGPWELGDLAESVEKLFQPLANGLPASPFDKQLASLSHG
jgi:NAD(P)-dependent dehydrogenase (short-subunit alcohol dehydrogenase family)